MLRRGFNLGLALCAALLASNAGAAGTFEGAGKVTSVDVGKNLVLLEEQLYSLPNTTALNGTPVIYQLRPGSQIGFSGRVAAPYFVIDSVYIYPEQLQQPHESLLGSPK
ncbi:MAG: PilY2 family type 4a fimbrial biogenesis protein [Pseudomonas sp.]|uniref:PilY2 family type 4a fimbrial biogenesis protein n=1 Tax=Pseudomonas sp. TaxID=306 RepID=UPI003392CA89